MLITINDTDRKFQTYLNIDKKKAYLMYFQKIEK